MLGNEYNWLISFTRRAEGAPKITLVRTGWLTLTIAVFCFLCLALQAAPTPATRRVESNASTATGEFTAATPASSLHHSDSR